MKTLVIGTRGSKLALRQAQWVADRLAGLASEIEVAVQTIVTQGEIAADIPLPQIGRKGLFTHEIEAALLQGRIHAAVHSLKDLPTELPPDLSLAAVPERADARDAWLSTAGRGLTDLPAGSVVGTSSLRRAAQILARRPDLKIMDLRGNVDTRLRKLEAGQYDAIVLAAAGLHRLGLADRITEYLSPDVLMPAPGQGALAVETRADDAETLTLLARLDHAPTRTSVTAERTLLMTLGGGCQLPVGAYGVVDEAAGTLRLRGLIAAVDGSRAVRGEITGPSAQASRLGVELAAELLGRGGKEIMKP